MKIVFFGSDDFALVHLRGLIGMGVDVVACVTQPDRPKGRGMMICKSPIKEFAVERGIPVVQPMTLKEENIFDVLTSYEADYFVVIAYGCILPQGILDIPCKASINVHGSLLPKYRGAAPINWAVINGEIFSGLSIILMNAKMDAGDILAQKLIEIHREDTASVVRERMMAVGPEFLVSVLKDYDKGVIQPRQQDESEVSFAVKLDQSLACIDWNDNGTDIINKIRGVLPRLQAFTFYEKKKFKILEAFSSDLEGKSGQVSEVRKDGFVVGTGRGSLLITRVHWENSRPMSTADFLRGHRLDVGYIFEKER